MADPLEVHIRLGADTHRVGTLHSHARAGTESTTFRYHEDWLRNPVRFPLQPALPLGRDGHHTAGERGGLPGALRDGSPDRWGRKLIQRAAQKGRVAAPISEVGYLVALDDLTRIGALRYRFEGQEEFVRGPADRPVPPLVTLPRLMNAADAVEKDTATAEDLRFLLGDGSPLGGARPKSAVRDADGLLAIAKFPKADDTRSIAAGEVLMAELARRAGVAAAEARLLRVGDRAVSLIRRFDRTGGGERRHFVSAMTMLGAQDGEEAAYTDIALAIRRYGADPGRDARELFRRVALNVLGTNLDDHLRNHGFLYDPATAKWRLAPAYDMNPVPITERRRELTTWVSEGGPDAALDPLLKAAPEFMLKLPEAREVVREVAEATRRWREVGRQLGLTDAELAPYETAFEHDEAGSALRAQAPAAAVGPGPAPSARAPRASSGPSP